MFDYLQKKCKAVQAKVTRAKDQSKEFFRRTFGLSRRPTAPAAAPPAAEHDHNSPQGPANGAITQHHGDTKGVMIAAPTDHPNDHVKKHSKDHEDHNDKHDTNDHYQHNVNETDDHNAQHGEINLPAGHTGEVEQGGQNGDLDGVWPQAGARQESASSQHQTGTINEDINDVGYFVPGPDEKHTPNQGNAKVSTVVPIRPCTPTPPLSPTTGPASPDTHPTHLDDIAPTRRIPPIEPRSPINRRGNVFTVTEINKVQTMLSDGPTDGHYSAFPRPNGWVWGEEEGYDAVDNRSSMYD